VHVSKILVIRIRTNGGFGLVFGSLVRGVSFGVGLSLLLLIVREVVGEKSGDDLVDFGVGVVGVLLFQMFLKHDDLISRILVGQVSFSLLSLLL
jgi:hypothetical protein